LENKLKDKNERPQVVGLLGLPGAGKDTVADAMVFQSQYKKLKFATPLYKIAAIILSVEDYRDLLEWTQEEKAKPQRRLGGKSLRDFLQNFGTDYMRNQYNDNIWLDILESDLQGHIIEDEDVVISDVRFPNEIALVNRYNGVNAFLERDGAEANHKHVAENVDKELATKVVDNNGDVTSTVLKVLTK